MMRISAGRLVISCGLALVSACAAGKRSSAPAQPAKSAQSCEMCLDAPRQESSAPGAAAPPHDGASANKESEDRAYSAPPPGAPVAPPAAEPAAPTPDTSRKAAPGAADPHSSSTIARVRLSEARRELEIATSERDCARACRALESMERAARQVCELARSPEERRECTSAGEQVDKARSRVQSACGGCSQNPR